MKKIALFVSLVVVLAMVVGCGGKGAQLWRPSDSPGYLDMEGKKFLVMPVDMRTVQGDKIALSAALFAGLLKEFGENGIALQPIQPALEGVGLGDLSWKLAGGLVHAAFFHQSSKWDACGGEDYSVVPNMVKTLVEKVAELLGKPELKFDYIAVLHIDSYAGSLPKTSKLRVYGGIYEPATDKIAVAIDYEQTTAEDAMLAEMATIGPKAIAIMAGDNPNKKPAEAAPAETKPEEKPAEEAPAPAAE